MHQYGTCLCSSRRTSSSQYWWPRWFDDTRDGSLAATSVSTVLFIYLFLIGTLTQVIISENIVLRYHRHAVTDLYRPPTLLMKFKPAWWPTAIGTWFVTGLPRNVVRLPVAAVVKIVHLTIAPFPFIHTHTRPYNTVSRYPVQFVHPYKTCRTVLRRATSPWDMDRF